MTVAVSIAVDPGAIVGFLIVAALLVIVGWVGRGEWDLYQRATGRHRRPSDRTVNPRARW